MFTAGKTKVIATINKIFKQSISDKDRLNATISTRYLMCPFSPIDSRIKGRSYSKGRTREINKVITNVFKSTILVNEYPGEQIYIIADIIIADGGTRCAAINAISVALGLSNISFKGLVSSISFGKYDDKIMIDLNGNEDKNSQSDCPIAIRYPDNKILLFQMDGILTINELFEGLDLVKKESSDFTRDSHNERWKWLKRFEKDID